MAIQRTEQGTGGNRISEPGDYVTHIIETKTGLTKTSKKPMLTIVFETDDEKKINDYFVLGLDFRMKALQALKAAAGLGAESKDPGALVGKLVGIAVEARPPNEEGKIYMQIVGYGKPEEVDGFSKGPSATDKIDF